MWIITITKRFLIAALALYILAFAVAWVLRGWLIYPFNSVYVTPKAAGEPRLHERQITTTDGETLIVWAAKAKGNKATIVYFHGNAGNLANRSERFDRLLDRNYGLVALAYRGSSGSTGRPSERNIIQDAILVRNSLDKLLGVAPKGPIVYFGESLGTAVAAKLSVTSPPDGLVLEAPFTSMLDMAARTMPYFPIRHVLDQKWQTLTTIAKITSPTLVIHGTSDIVVPYQMGETVYQHSAAARKKFISIPNGSHTSGFSVQGQTAIYQFIESL